MESTWGHRAFVGSLLLPAILAPSCAGPRGRGPNSSTPWRELPEYQLLAQMEGFECSALDFGGYTPDSAVAFARLVLRDDAALVFDDLAQQSDLGARVYGVKGLWFTDRSRYLREAEAMQNLDAMVPTHCGCIGGPQAVRELFTESSAGKLVDMAGPVDLFRSGASWLADADPRGEDAAHWRSSLLGSKDHDQKVWAAKALAYSLDGPGLDALLGCLPLLEAELQREVVELLEHIPPWCRGTLEVVTAKLQDEDRTVQWGALHALQSLMTYRSSRDAARVLVSRLEQMLASYEPPATESDEAPMSDWLDTLLSDLRRIGGPAGPVLARALGNREESVREEIEIHFENLGAWADETVAELGRALERSDPKARASLVHLLVFSMRDVIDPRRAAHVSPDVAAAVRNLVSDLRKAIATLDEPERKELEESLEEAMGESSGQSDPTE